MRCSRGGWRRVQQRRLHVAGHRRRCSAGAADVAASAVAAGRHGHPGLRRAWRPRRMVAGRPQRSRRLWDNTPCRPCHAAMCPARQRAACARPRRLLARGWWGLGLGLRGRRAGRRACITRPRRGHMTRCSAARRQQALAAGRAPCPAARGPALQRRAGGRAAGRRARGGRCLVQLRRRHRQEDGERGRRRTPPRVDAAVRAGARRGRTARPWRALARRGSRLTRVWRPPSPAVPARRPRRDRRARLPRVARGAAKGRGGSCRRRAGAPRPAQRGRGSGLVSLRGLVAVRRQSCRLRQRRLRRRRWQRRRHAVCRHCGVAVRAVRGHVGALRRARRRGRWLRCRPLITARQGRARGALAAAAAACGVPAAGCAGLELGRA